MEIDKSIIGILKSIFYLIASGYVWIESVGLNAYVLAVLLIFMASDMILGWIKATVVFELENPTSKKAKKGILAKIVMFAIPVVVGLIWKAFDSSDNVFVIVNTLLTGLMIAEGYSVIANAGTIYSGEPITEFDAVTYVFKKTGEKIKTLLEKIMG